MDAIDILEQADREQLDAQQTVQLLVDKLGIDRDLAIDIVDTANGGGDIVED
jgi:hypothetical protein